MKNPQPIRGTNPHLAAVLLLFAVVIPADVLGGDTLLPPFGPALAKGMAVEGRPEYRQRPITVECWAKLDEGSGINNATAFNILVASDRKDSPEHWELFSTANKGTFAVYQTGLGVVDSGVPIRDGQWHYLAAVIEPERVRLYVDGLLVQDAETPLLGGGESQPNTLAFGRLVEGTLGFNGKLDNVRLSSGAREIDGMPSGPLKEDETTIGLWDFDEDGN